MSPHPMHVSSVRIWNAHAGAELRPGTSKHRRSWKRVVAVHTLLFTLQAAHFSLCFHALLQAVRITLHASRFLLYTASFATNAVRSMSCITMTSGVRYHTCEHSGSWVASCFLLLYFICADPQRPICSRGLKTSKSGSKLLATLLTWNEHILRFLFRRVHQHLTVFHRFKGFTVRLTDQFLLDEWESQPETTVSSFNLSSLKSYIKQ
jgi:hypothetical protein